MLLDSVVVRHGGGGDLQAGQSVLAFKSYEKGREKWQGETLEGVWFDEEPPLDKFSRHMWPRPTSPRKACASSVTRSWPACGS